MEVVKINPLLQEAEELVKITNTIRHKRKKL